MQALENMEIAPAFYASSEIDPRCCKVVRRWWPSVIELGALEEVNEETVGELLIQFPRVKHLLIVGGTPCQDLSGLNPSGQGLEGSKSGLFWVFVEKAELVKRVAAKFQVSTDVLLENVTSMDSHGPEARQGISAIFGRPFKLCSGELCWVRRPRYYWCSYRVNLDGSTDLVAEEEKEWTRLRGRGRRVKCIKFEGGAVRTGSSSGQKPFLTFVSAVSKSKPGWRPAGLARSSPSMLRRWKQDLYRSAPYQYCTENGVLQRGRWRPLKAVEREQLMGFRRNHTLAGLHKHEIKSEEAEDVRRSLVGNSFNVYAISVFIAAWLFGKGLAEGNISLEFVCGIPTGRPRRELLNYLSYLKRIGRTAEEEMTWGLHRRATFRGGDVRRGGLVLVSPTCGRGRAWPATCGNGGR
jgi:site-specific DNA-cytosine methylase